MLPKQATLGPSHSFEEATPAPQPPPARRPSPRPPVPLRPRARELSLIGITFLGLAGFFFWRDLNLGLESVVLPVAVLMSFLVVSRRQSTVRDLGVFGLLLCGIGGGAWFAALSPPALLWGLGAAFLGAIVAVVRAPSGDRIDDLRARRWAWRTFSVNFLGASFAAYFQFLTLGVGAEAVARRMVLTGTWLVAGLTLLVVGQRRSRDEITGAGVMVVAAALLKAAFYDTTHLGGGLRVVTMVVTGALLLGAAALLPRRPEDAGAGSADE